MSQRSKTTPSGQRSIASFFSPKSTKKSVEEVSPAPASLGGGPAGVKADVAPSPPSRTPQRRGKEATQVAVPAAAALSPEEAPEAREEEGDIAVVARRAPARTPPVKIARARQRGTAGGAPRGAAEPGTGKPVAVSKGKKRAPVARRRALRDSDDEGGDGSGSESEAAASGSDFEPSESESDDDASDLASEGEEDDVESAEEEEEEEEDVVDVRGKRKLGRATGAGSKRPRGDAARTPIAKPTPAKATPAKTTPAQVTPSFKATPSTKLTPFGRAPPATPTGGLSFGTPVGATPIAATPGAATPSLKESLGTDDADRFGPRMLQLFPFLSPDKLRDAAGRRPDHPDYDPRTLLVPEAALKAAAVSEGQRQWWRFKSEARDAVLMFKVGKFYELFEMDAHVGVETIGLTYMRGERAHAGFPEAAYAAMAGGLVRAGYKVAVIEQVETPEALAARNEDRRRRGLKRENVVRRERVAVMSRGTLRDPELLAGEASTPWLLSLHEAPGAPDDDNVTLGACAIDASTGRVLVAQWRDNELRGSLRAVLSALAPVELVLPRGLSRPTRRVVEQLGGDPRIAELPASLPCWQPVPALEAYRAALERTGGLGTVLPAPLAAAAAEPERHAAVLGALGGAFEVLHDAFIDAAVASTRRVERLEDAYGVGGWDEGEGGERALGGASEAAPAPPLAPPTEAASAAPHVLLDGAALENLEVVSSASEVGGAAAGTLLANLDQCATPGGRARLRCWLCRPLLRAADIVARQDAVAELAGPLCDAAAAARAALKGLTDLERGVARLVASGSGAGAARDAPHVVLYEDVARKRVRAVAGVLRGLASIRQAAASICEAAPQSRVLRELCQPGARFPDLDGPLDALLDATDWDDALRTGAVLPRPGADERFDAAQRGVAAADRDIEAYLKTVRTTIRQATIISLQRDSHVLEVPEGVTVPRAWEPRANKKGVKRYVSPELKALVEAREQALQELQDSRAAILTGLIRKFSTHALAWSAATDCASELDALMSLAIAASCGDGPMARPEFVEPAEGEPAVFEARGLRHPAGLPGAGVSFVPNDVVLGAGGAPTFVVLTGPNMGGKSTLMRQVCLAAVAAQAGAWLPAESLRMTPVDAVFVRTGARDLLVSGQSTFFVEIAETAAALRRATPCSLVALDELGRGTSTADGAAIAGAVLTHLSARVGCRGLFATHYHSVAAAHEHDPCAALAHMTCRVTEAGSDGGEEEAADVPEVTFLYKLAPGSCPKSYGPNVARLAGLPREVVRRAAAVARRIEQGMSPVEGGVAGVAALRAAVAAARAQDEGALRAARDEARALLA